MSAANPIDLGDTSSSEDEQDLGDGGTREEAKRDTGDIGTDTAGITAAEFGAAQSSDDNSICRGGSGSFLPQRHNTLSRASLAQPHESAPSETQTTPQLTQNPREKADDGNAAVADNAGSQHSNEDNESTDDEVVCWGSRASVPQPENDTSIAELYDSLQGLTTDQILERVKNDPRLLQERWDSPVCSLADKGKSIDDTIDISDGSSIISVHSVLDVDARLNPDFDDVSVIVMSASEEEEETSDDDETITSSERPKRPKLKPRKMPFMGDTSFMLASKQSNVTDEPLIQPPKKAPQALKVPTRKRVSIKEKAEAFKKEHGLKGDEKIVVVEAALRKVRKKRNLALREKAKRLRRFRRGKQGRAVAEAQGTIQEFPTHPSEEPCHIRGEYLDDPIHPIPQHPVTLIMLKERTSYFDEGVTKLLDVCYDFECTGWIDYRDGLQQLRKIPRYIIERRIKEAEEVVRLACKQFGTAKLPPYVQTYIAMLVNLSKNSINHILNQQSIEEVSANADPYKEVMSTFLELICPRCLVLDCTMHGAVSIEEYSCRTAEEVAMMKEESGFWKQLAKPNIEIQQNQNDVRYENPTAMSQTAKVLAKELCYMYDGDLDKVSTVLGASKSEVQRATKSERKGHKYRHLKKSHIDLQRFHGVQQSQKNLDREADGFEYTPCIHEGPCLEATCPCIQKGKPCTNFCIMGPLSSNFFPGCKCVSKCKTWYCPCHRAGRECDPDLCKTCQTCTDPAGLPEERKQKCRNDNIRMRRQNKGLFYDKSTILKAGWGLFCIEEIRQGEYIGEYLGEVINETEIEKRRKGGENLDYLFYLGENHSVDGLREGNITRFMNHTDENPNVRAGIVKVDGDSRIAFFARRKIPARTELLFNYGRWYKTDFSIEATSTSESRKESLNSTPSFALV